MMPFAEKLSFLMYITQTSNKELAAELCVEPDSGRTVDGSRTAEPAVRLLATVLPESGRSVKGARETGVHFTLDGSD